MKKRKREVKLYVRTTPELRSAFKAMLGAVGGAPAFATRPGLLSQEQVMNAVWLMLRDDDPAALAARLAPYVSKAEKLMAEYAATVLAEEAAEKEAAAVKGPDEHPVRRVTPRRKGPV